MKTQSLCATALVSLMLIASKPLATAQIPDSLKAIENQYVSAFQIHAEEAHLKKIAELEGRYLQALGKAFQGATNEFGLYDMGGNVWEWVEDWYTEAKTECVLRGGSWGHCKRDDLLSSSRYHYTPDLRNRNFGFRVVLEVSGK